MSTGQGAVLYGWGGNRRFGVSQASSPTLCGISTYGLNSLHSSKRYRTFNLSKDGSVLE